MNRSPSGLILNEGNTPPEQSMSSLEAAALILSGGETRDPNLAVQIANAPTFDLDVASRSHLRRSMGFDFDFVITSPTRAAVRATDGSGVTAVARFKKEATVEEKIESIVRACLRLKKKWDKVNAPRSND